MISIMSLATSCIEVSIPVPKLTDSTLSYFSAARINPAAASSTYKKSRVGVPSPQSSIIFLEFIFAFQIFLIMAGTTCEVKSWKLSLGP